MRICYVDETGTDGNSPVVVFVGLVVDTTKQAKIDRELRERFDAIYALAKWPLDELKGAHMYPGKKHWRGIDTRHDAIADLCEWYTETSNCHIALSAVETSTYAGSELFELTELGIWSAGALHIALQIQKSGQGRNKNKGSTFMVFDEQEIYKNELADLLLDPPECTDAYYERDAKAVPFDQVIDTPFFVQSERVPAIQLADVFAFIIRRHIEIADGHREERFDGEGALLQTWFDHLEARLLPASARSPKRPRSDLADAYRSSMPSTLAH